MRWRTVPSLHCSSCEDHLKSVLSSVPRLRDLSTNVPQHTVTFTIDPDDPDDNNTSSLSRKSIVRSVQHVLNASGYASYREQQRAGGLFRRLTNAVLGHERRLHERHLTHCAACQETPSQHEEKDDEASLTTVQVDSRAPPKVVETRIAIEGMTCRCAIFIAHLPITAGLINPTLATPLPLLDISQRISLCPTLIFL
jgi:copper chaperone CopZ